MQFSLYGWIVKKKSNFAQSIKMMAIPGKTKQIYSIFLMVALLGACSRNKKVDVSNIHVDVTVERFDKDFNAMSVKPMDAQAKFLQKKYGVFYKDFIEQILQAGTINDTAYYQTLRDVFKGQAYKDLKHDVDSIYPNMDEQNAALTDAFRRIKYYFPKQKLPKVYAYFSGFEAQTSIGDGYFAIGLDLFLGANSRFYPALTKAFPHYLSRDFTPDNIAPRVVEGIARETMFPENDDDKSLLTKMIYNGKIMYFMDQVLPDVPDSTKIGYTDAQLKWCNSFESSVWGYFLQENLLYETDYPKIQKYLGVAPFTPGLGEKNESAPRLGIWTGWQIVRKYMDKHPEVTLPQLMADTDAQKILNDSKYHPK
jgi:gliding motility-associated lipoprotein GldB